LYTENTILAILYDKKSLLENKKFIKTASALYGGNVEKAAERYSQLVNAHRENIDGEIIFYSASGRIEVCGNHTDHNNGKVLCAAVSVDLLACVTPLDEQKIVVKSLGYPVVEVDISDLSIHEEEKGGSFALVRGVCKAFKDRGYNIGGFYATTVSDVFKGAGMSSSASFEVLVSAILDNLYNGDSISAVEKAIISQYAENVYFGKPSGLMDQSAIALGGVSFIDFKDPSAPVVEKLDWNFDDTTVFVVNCGGDHCNLTPQYAAIREEMEAIAKEFGEEKLRFVNEDEFYMSIPSLKDKFSGRAILRAMHYYEENERVELLREAIRSGDEELAYDIISASGISSYQKLQNCYAEGDPSEPIPLALALCGALEGVMAYRVHGGGFAGTILAFVENDSADDFHDFMAHTFGDSNVYRLKIRNEGGTRLDLGEND
ncbi:MAG: galactokinase, partial [Clostridia bacterium]|nr:galactokinase [Clostridia bacterium]